MALVTGYVVNCRRVLIRNPRLLVQLSPTVVSVKWSYVNNGTSRKNLNSPFVPVSYTGASFLPDQQVDAPARLKNELEQLLTLQGEIDAVHASIQKAKTLTKSKNSKSIRNLLSSLENTQTILETQADDLYASLDIIGDFPELRGVSLVFLRTLLLARDLKINIRKKAVGSFFEWERLDRAVAGVHNPLGRTCFSTLNINLAVLIRHKAASSHSELHL